MPGRTSNFGYTEENPENVTTNNSSGRASNAIAQMPPTQNPIPPHLQYQYDQDAQANQAAPGTIAPGADPNDATPAGSLDDYTAILYNQLLGLMDEQANQELASTQIGELSSILSQKSALAGKDLAAGRFASGGATAADISEILRGEQQALSSGVTAIQGQALARTQANKREALNMMMNLRGQLSMEQQADFDNRIQEAMFEFEKWRTEEGFRLNEEEQEAQRIGLLIQAFDAIIPG